jgi:tRNA pseudouridine55 synthase
VNHGILLCDKPVGRSSHDVVATARKAFGTRRVGHAGTLDPMATGLLVLAIGEALKIMRYLALDDKRYSATVRLGSETDTLDAEGRVTASATVPAGMTLAMVRAAAERFCGEIAQCPPAISALKQDGVALYKRARRGEQVEVQPRSVVVHALEVTALRVDEIDLVVHSGKGFYVRSLARDLGRALGTLGHLSALRRTHSGRFDVADAVSFDQELALVAKNDALRGELARKLLPLDVALATAPRLVLDAAGVEHVRQGRPIPLSHVVAGDELESGAVALAEIEPVLLSSGEGELLAVARCSEAVLRVVRGLRL